MAPASTTQPNILLIVADDMGYGDLGNFHKDATTRLPNLDALAQAGMRFSRFYTESTCAASRAALLTGQYPARLGFHPVARGISADVVTLPDALGSAGYRTRHIGKWHLGEISPQATPTKAGFDSSFGFMSQWLLQGPDAHGVPQLKSPVYFEPWLQRSEADSWRQYAGYLPDILTREAVSQIEAWAAPGAPWFMWYATPLAHAPLHLPPDSGLDNAASDDEKYQAMLQRMDKDIGALLTALKRTGQMENTVIVFLSDNGAPHKRDRSNGLFTGGKSGYGEGGIRTPMIWVDPASVLPDSVDARAVSIMDVFPTLLARANVPVPPEIDGVDLFDNNAYAKLRYRPLFWLAGDGFSILAPDHNRRYSASWLLSTWQDSHWYQYSEQGVGEASWFRWLEHRQIDELKSDFSQWLDEVMQTHVRIEQDASGIRAQGAGFLRTPLKLWDFYIALKAQSGQGGEQMIAEQPGSWSLWWRPSEQMLHLSMHGGSHSWPVKLDGACTLIGLNADLYDRYTNVDGSVYPSRVRLSVNGEEVGRGSWTVDSLATVDVDSPTFIGRDEQGLRRWQGKLSEPVFYHRGAFVGDTPFLPDEKKLHTAGCMQFPMSR